ILAAPVWPALPPALSHPAPEPPGQAVPAALPRPNRLRPVGLQRDPPPGEVARQRRRHAPCRYRPGSQTPSAARVSPQPTAELTRILQGALERLPGHPGRAQDNLRRGADLREHASARVRPASREDWQAYCDPSRGARADARPVIVQTR